ncbi:unnamed protein product [Effrenium voratum]|nr:unnamed protein product [Effrenium voratum]
MVGSSSFTAAPPMTTDWSLQPASSMMVTPQLSNPLQSTPSMIAYPGMGAMGAMGAPSYSSAMDGPFKFYATPPGKLPEAEQRPAARMEDEVQTGASLRAGALLHPEVMKAMRVRSPLRSTPPRRRRAVAAEHSRDSEVALSSKGA